MVNCNLYRLLFNNLLDVNALVNEANKFPFLVVSTACAGARVCWHRNEAQPGYTDDDKMFVYLLFLPFSDEYLLIENTYISLEEMLFEMD